MANRRKRGYQKIIGYGNDTSSRRVPLADNASGIRLIARDDCSFKTFLSRHLLCTVGRRNLDTLSARKSGIQRQTDGFRVQNPTIRGLQKLHQISKRDPAVPAERSVRLNDATVAPSLHRGFTDLKC